LAPRIGFHAPIAGGLHKALLRAKELDCTAVQIFSRNPRGWMARPLSAEEIELFRKTRRETGISPVVIHANYLINLAAADAAVREKSIRAFREEVERGILLGADYVVVHPGSARGACEDDGIETCAASLRAACAGLEANSLRILVENTAGQGDCIGHRFEHLRRIIELCPELELGACFDTAHAFAAGYELRDEEGLKRTLRELERNVGAVPVVHFNDSKAAFASRVDRHWHIGEGQIGREAMHRIAGHRQFRNAAFLIETPQDSPEDDARNLSLLRSFVQREKRSATGRLKN